MKSKFVRLSSHQYRYLAYIARHPGCCIADVDRACRVNPRAGHKWVYDGVGRLARRGLIRRQSSGTRVLLFPVEGPPCP